MCADCNDIKIYAEDDEDLPLVPPGGCGEGDEGTFVYDETGVLALAESTVSPVARLPEEPVIGRWRIPTSLYCACSMRTLNGSWLVRITPRSLWPHVHFRQSIRGPMRIEAANGVLRVSGDVYVAQPFLPARASPPRLSLVIRRNWYPSFAQSEYRWYFRSTGTNYTKTRSGGTLCFSFARHLWDTTSQEFVAQDTGWMRFNCTESLIRSIYLPQPTAEMRGEAMIGGRRYDVSAIKTSPYYRGCLVEVDVMRNRSWPASAADCSSSRTYSFSGVYRSHGLDFKAVVDERNVPDDPHLTTAELHNLLATHRSLSAGSHDWRLWLFVGSRRDGTLGLMFDSIAPHREGAVGFYDPTFPNVSVFDPSVRGQKVGDVPLAFLRTLLHEAGHVFNLFHPKHDVHAPPVSTTIMNQTGDVAIQANLTPPLYPCNATFAFNEHNRTSLIHSPDPQVKPGWKPFAWGHGSLWSGLPAPVDALGLDAGGAVAEDLRLDLNVPGEVRPGELITATFTVTNTGDAPRQVTTALNLAEGNLRLKVTDPGGLTEDVGDVVLLCGRLRLAELAPGAQRSGSAQLLFTNRGFRFEQPGRYVLQAELDTQDDPGSVARSEPVELIVRPATTEEEKGLQALVMDEGVGLSLALGDFGADADARARMAKVVDDFAGSDTGAACAMVMANSLARDFRDPLQGKVLRKADESEKGRYLDIALADRSAADVAQLATVVAAVRETDAPILSDVKGKIGGRKYKKDDREQADRILDDYLE